ncbi:MAG: ATP-binding protein [Chloroflexota bacterium]
MDELRPAGLFDRDNEWRDLLRFAQGPATGPRVGVIYGRRRQGKSFLLRALARQLGGIYHQALEEEAVPALGHLGTTVASDADLNGHLTFSDWSEAIKALLDRAGPDRLAIIDEFPYLLAQSPELASIIQKAFDDARHGQGSAFRLLLCGSAMSIMERMLSGQKALRGRAALDMPLLPFDFRQSAAYWEIKDPETAFLVHAVLGGTPGYRDLLDGATPASPAAFLEWLAAGVLNPSHALFREADYLLTEDPAIADRALYQSVLATIAGGRSTRSAVAAALGRNESGLRHPLLVLERAGFIRRDDDLLLSKRPLIRIADPYLRFHHAVVRPDLSRFEARDFSGAWIDARPRFESNVLGPHFEALARDWTSRFASRRTLGGRPSRVGFTQVNDASNRSRMELDVVAIAGSANADRPIVLAIGEAKGGSTKRGLADLRRLERGRSLLADRAETSASRLLLFSRAGFEPDLVAASRVRRDVELIDLGRLYEGD